MSKKQLGFRQHCLNILRYNWLKNETRSTNSPNIRRQDPNKYSQSETRGLSGKEQSRQCHHLTVKLDFVTQNKTQFNSESVTLSILAHQRKTVRACNIFTVESWHVSFLKYVKVFFFERLFCFPKNIFQSSAHPVLQKSALLNVQRADLLQVHPVGRSVGCHHAQNIFKTLIMLYFRKAQGPRTSKLIFPTVKCTNTNSQIHKYSL